MRSIHFFPIDNRTLLHILSSAGFFSNHAMDQQANVVANDQNENIAVVRSGTRFRMNCCDCRCNFFSTIRDGLLNHKAAVVAIIIISLFFSLPIIALIMSTGRIWRCPGEPRS